MLPAQHAGGVVVRSRPALLLSALALVLAGLSVLASGPSTAASAGARSTNAPQLARQGRWLVDPQCRVVLVHGLNLVWKRAPYAPPPTAEGFTAKDASWLHR